MSNTKKMTPEDREKLASKKLREWFSGATCYRFIKVLEEVGDFYIVRHSSHSEYLNRMSGSSTCRSWTAPVRKDHTIDNGVGGLRGNLALCIEKVPMYTEGRVSKVRMNEIIEYCLQNS